MLSNNDWQLVENYNLLSDIGNNQISLTLLDGENQHITRFEELTPDKAALYVDLLRNETPIYWNSERKVLSIGRTLK